MKILALSRSFPPLIGGISNSLKSLYDSLKVRNHDIAVFIFPFNFNQQITFQEGVFGVKEMKKYIVKNIPHFHFTILRFFIEILTLNSSLISKLKIIFHYLKYIKLLINMVNYFEILNYYNQIYNFDLILSYDSGLSAQIGYLLKVKQGTKLIVVSHGNDILNKKMSPFTKKILLKSDRIIVRSNFIKNLIISNFRVDKNKIYICTDGIQPEEFKIQKTKQELREELKIDQDDFVILSVGLLNLVRKGYDLVLKSVFQLREKYGLNIEKVKYILIGRDNVKVRTWLNNLAKKLNLTQNFFVFADAPNELRNKYYKASDIFVMPSRDLRKKESIEGFGNVYIEANFFKLPVIGTRTGGIPDAIEDGKTGFLINSFDELVDKIKLLYDNPELRSKMGENAFTRTITQFTWDKIYNDYMNVFKIP